MANAKIFRINYKSDFILTLVSDAGWMTPFCIKFWTGAPSQAYYVQFDGTTYTHCAPVDGDPTKLLVQFDDHHLPIGELKYQIAYHFTVADFPNDTEDEVLNQANITTEIDGETYQVMLDFTGETAPEIQFSLPAYANEAQRIANEEQRIANEQARIEAEQQRIDNEQTRQDNEAQRIAQETARVNEYAELKANAVAATNAANDAATLAAQKAQLAADKAALADAAATLAAQKAQLAADKAALADAAATLANQKAALAQQKAQYAQTQGDYAKAQGDYAKEQGEIAEEDHERAEADHTRAESDHATAGNDHTQAGTDHSTAVNDHTQSVTDHTQADTDHTRAESDHTQAASDHTQAGADHTRAENDHSTASADHTQAGQDHTRAESDHTRAESDHAAVELYIDSLGAFDISAYHATGGVLAKYADLTAALGTNGANIPEAIRKGGMSVKFVQTYDNKYVQYRLISDTFSTTESNWQGVDDMPTAGSKNLVKSGGVYKETELNRKIKAYKISQNSLLITDENGNLILSLLSGISIDENGVITTKNLDSRKILQGIKGIGEFTKDRLYVSDENGNLILSLLSGVSIDENGNVKTKNFNSINTISASTIESSSTDFMLAKHKMLMPLSMLSNKMVDKTNRLVISFNGDSILGSQLADISDTAEYNTGAYPPNMSRNIMARMFYDRYKFTGEDTQFRNLEHTDWVKSGFNINKGKGDKDNRNSSFNEFETWGCGSSDDNAQITVTGYSFFKLIWSRGNSTDLWSCDLLVSVDGGGFITPTAAGLTLPDTFGKPDINYKELQVYNITELNPNKTYTFKIVPNNNYSNVTVWGCEYWNNPRLDVVMEAFSGTTAEMQASKMLGAYCSEWHKPSLIISDLLVTNDESYIELSDYTIDKWMKDNATIYEHCKSNGIPLLLIVPHKVASDWLIKAGEGVPLTFNLPYFDIIKIMAENNTPLSQIVNLTDGVHLSNSGNTYYFEQIKKLFN